MTTKTLKPSGGDFSTFAGWVAYLSATLSAPEQLDIYKKSGGYVENNAISGITTTTTNRLIINVPSAERGNGTPYSGAYLKDSTGVLRFGANINYFTIDGLEIEGTGSAGALLDANGASAGANQRLIQHCFLHSADATTTIGANGIYLFRNNIVYTNSSVRQFDTRGAASFEVSNCTFFNRGTDLGIISSSEATIKNTYSGGSSTSDYWTGGSPSGNNNASSDTSATNRFPTGSVNSLSASSVLTNTTAGSEDFTLKSGANSLVDAGTTLAAVTDDFIGTSRPQNSIYDIGAFERVSGGGGITASGAWTEASDTWSGSGSVGVSGSVSWTEAKDIWAGSGAVAVSGTAAWTDVKDSWAGTGGIVATGTVSWTEASDTWSASGTVTTGPSGSVAWTEAKDIWAGSGAVAIAGAASWTEAADTWAITGSITLPGITGSVAWTEGLDTWAGRGSNGMIWTPVTPVITLWTPVTPGSNPWTPV